MDRIVIDRVVERLSLASGIDADVANGYHQGRR